MLYALFSSPPPPQKKNLTLLLILPHGLLRRAPQMNAERFFMPQSVDSGSERRRREREKMRHLAL